jgi:sigma-B regulation protein RsbU (phosphoserine phosphatase)
VFYKNNDYSLYFSIVLGFVNHKKKTLSFCQAGHPYPIYISRHSPASILGQGGFPVALLPSPSYESVVLSYQTGDRFFIYSDGVVECTNQQDEVFDSVQLIDYLQEHQTIPLNHLIEQLKTHLLDWHGTDKFDDDISLLGIEFV